MANVPARGNQPKSIIGWNADGSYEICRTRSTIGLVRNRLWFVSIRGPEPLRQWWHSPTDYTEKEAAAICHFLFNLSGHTLAHILEEKLAEALLPNQLKRDKRAAEEVEEIYT